MCFRCSRLPQRHAIVWANFAASSGALIPEGWSSIPDFCRNQRNFFGRIPAQWLSFPDFVRAAARKSFDRRRIDEGNAVRARPTLLDMLMLGKSPIANGAMNAIMSAVQSSRQRVPFLRN
jgi:hypothetical protein